MRTSLRPTVAIASLCVAVAAAPAAAADRAPDQLLKAYPLEQRPATLASTTPTRPSHRAAAPPAGTSKTGSPRLGQGAAIGIAAAAMLLAALVVVRRPRSGHAVSLAAAGAVAELPPAPVLEAAPEPAVPVAAAVLAPEAPPRPPAALPPEAARAGLLCQIRWRCDGGVSWFEAARVHDRDREVVAESPDFDWPGPGPPDRTPAAAAALEALVRDLAGGGWRRVRGRGRERGAPRWYALRYHLPALGPEPRPPDEPMDPLEAGFA